MEPESPRDGRALREMAKFASTPANPAHRGPAKKPSADSSGLVDLAALMAEQPNWLDDALARAKASAGSALAPPSITPVSLSPTMTDIADDGAVGVPRKGSLPIVIAATGAGLLVAAACVFALRMNGSQTHVAPPPPPVAAVAHVDQPAIPAPPPEVAAVAQPGAAQVTAAPAPEQPQARVAESDGPPVGRHWRHERHEARVAEARVAPIAAKAADAPPPVPKAASPAAPPPPPPHTGSALDAALRASVGNATLPAPAPAADPTPATAPKAAPPADGRPERPSGSAVTSTLTEVLNPARKCVAGMTDPSRALVTFGSDGAAHKIDLTGPAASDPTAVKCLKAAFSRAHVPPFSSASYAAGVTIRPQ